MAYYNSSNSSFKLASPVVIFIFFCFFVVPNHALNIGLHASADLKLFKECSRICESKFCEAPPFLRYGKYCGILYSGCPGEQPCDQLDACCMRHDQCIARKGNDYLSQECNNGFKYCVERFRKSGAPSFKGNTCDVDTVVQVITDVMDAAILAGKVFDMSELVVALKYGGEWKLSGNNWIWNSDTSCIDYYFVDRKITFEGLYNTICEKTGYNWYTNDVKIYRRIGEVGEPGVILNESQWEVIKHMHSNSSEIVLYVTCTLKIGVTLSREGTPVREGTPRREGTLSSEVGPRKLTVRANGRQVHDRASFLNIHNRCDQGSSERNRDSSRSRIASNPTPPLSNVREDVDEALRPIAEEHVNNEAEIVDEPIPWSYDQCIVGVGQGDYVQAENFNEPPTQFGQAENFNEPPTQFEQVENFDYVPSSYDGGTSYDGQAPNFDEPNFNVPIICSGSNSSQGRNDGFGWQIGQRFKNKKEFIFQLGLAALANHFQIKTSKSSKKRKTAKCVTSNCPWRIYATKEKVGDEFVIRTYTNIHTCDLMDMNAHHRQATSSLIGNRTQGLYLNANVPPGPEVLQNFMRTEENVVISYGKAWRGKQVALDIVRGTFEENFAKLPSYCYMMEQLNPGTLTRIHTDSEKKFKYFFMALGAAIRGFEFLRDVIIIDATFMINKYKGVVLIASATDSERHCYPLAWGVGDSENTECWTWFLECLKELIPDRENLIIVSDRGVPIANAIKAVYPLAEHGACYWHIKRNLLKKWNDSDLANLFQHACYAYTERDFEKFFSILKAKNERCANWLEHDVGFEKWSRLHQRVLRYETMTSKTVEVLNKVILKAKNFPICSFVGYILRMMGKWFYKRRVQATNLNGQLTKDREETLRKRYESAGMWDVGKLGYRKWTMESTKWKGIVDLDEKSCSCGVFQIERMPCEHAIAAAMDYKPVETGKYIYELTSRYYRRDLMINAYVEVIYPVPSEDQWMNIPDDVKMREVLPPDEKRTVGRPRTSRFKSCLEKVKKIYKCSICKGSGHNAKTCPQRGENLEQS